MLPQPVAATPPLLPPLCPPSTPLPPPPPPAVTPLLTPLLQQPVAATQHPRPPLSRASHRRAPNTPKRTRATRARRLQPQTQSRLRIFTAGTALWEAMARIAPRNFGAVTIIASGGLISEWMDGWVHRYNMPFLAAWWICRFWAVFQAV